jgi:hypothetical protein
VTRVSTLDLEGFAVTEDEKGTHVDAEILSDDYERPEVIAFMKVVHRTTNRSFEALNGGRRVVASATGMLGAELRDAAMHLVAAGIGKKVRLTPS